MNVTKVHIRMNSNGLKFQFILIQSCLLEYNNLL